jgi:hypothetical protein
MTEEHSENIWIVALYEQESRANELLDRLSAIGVDTTEATTLRVEINDQMRAAKITPLETPFSITSRSVVAGALIGGATAFFLGVVLYSLGLLKLPYLAGVFHHALASVIAGALLGGILGAFLGASRQRRVSRIPIPQGHMLKSDGYLVTVRMPPPLAERAEEIARGLGAKQILL